MALEVSACLAPESMLTTVSTAGKRKLLMMMLISADQFPVTTRCSLLTLWSATKLSARFWWMFWAYHNCQGLNSAGKPWMLCFIAVMLLLCRDVNLT